MSESAAGKFSELWKGVSKLCDGKTFNTATEQQMAATETSMIKGDGGVGNEKSTGLHTSAGETAGRRSKLNIRSLRPDSGLRCALQVSRVRRADTAARGSAWFTGILPEMWSLLKTSCGTARHPTQVASRHV